MTDESLIAKVRAYLDDPGGWQATGSPGLRAILNAAESADAREREMLRDPHIGRQHPGGRWYRRRSFEVTGWDPDFKPPRSGSHAQNHTAVFQDIETGILVTDPARFEHWLKTITPQEGTET